MICSNCGHPLDEGKIFCENCGHFNTAKDNATAHQIEITEGSVNFYSILASFITTIIVGKLVLAVQMGIWSLGISPLLLHGLSFLSLAACIFLVFVISGKIGGKVSGITGICLVILGFISFATATSFPGYLLGGLFVSLGTALFAATIFHRDRENISRSVYFGVGMGIIANFVSGFLNGWLFENFGFSMIFLATSVFILLSGFFALLYPGSFTKALPPQNISRSQKILPALILFGVPWVASFIIPFMR